MSQRSFDREGVNVHSAQKISQVSPYHLHIYYTKLKQFVAGSIINVTTNHLVTESINLASAGFVKAARAKFVYQARNQMMKKIGDCYCNSDWYVFCCSSFNIAPVWRRQLCNIHKRCLSSLYHSWWKRCSQSQEKRHQSGSSLFTGCSPWGRTSLAVSTHGWGICCYWTICWTKFRSCNSEATWRSKQVLPSCHTM